MKGVQDEIANQGASEEGNKPGVDVENKPKIASDMVTRGIRVRAVARYMPEHSSPDQDRYFFSYRIVISNEGTEAAQLLSRHWVIIDSHGKRSDVRGPGVVGHTPRLEPGEDFEYSSFCPLETDFGTMEGTYRMTSDDGQEFDAQVARFYLAMNAPVPEEPAPDDSPE